jgi:hypothetical protein
MTDLRCSRARAADVGRRLRDGRRRRVRCSRGPRAAHTAHRNRLAGVVVGVGGGITRDVLLSLELAAITNWYDIPAVLIAAIIGGWPHTGSRLPFLATQAIAIGLLIGIGGQKALEYRAPIPAVIFLGVVTGAFGGALADILAGTRAAIMSEGHLLLSVVILGAVVFWLCTTYIGSGVPALRGCRPASGGIGFAAAFRVLPRMLPRLRPPAPRAGDRSPNPHS